MNGLVEAAPSLLLWGVVLTRARTVTDRGHRRLWCALLALALAVTVNVEAVADTIDAITWLVPNTSSLLKHSLVVIAAQQAYEAGRYLTRTPQQAADGRGARTAAAGAVVTALSVLFLLNPRNEQTDSFTRTYADEPAIALFWALYLATLGVCLASVAHLSFAHRGRLPRGPTRTGSSLVGVGMLFALAYVTVKIGFVVAAQPGGPDAATAATVEAHLTPWLLAGSMTGIVAGVIIPGVAARPWAAQLLARYQYARLELLWREMTTAVPHVQFDTAAGRSLLHDDEAQLRLYRRVVEILDAHLTLAPYVSPLDWHHARQAVLDRHLPERREAALLDRTEIELALRALAADAQPHPSPARPGTRRMRTGSEEIDHLRAVARAGADARDLLDRTVSRPSPAPVRR